MFVTNPIAVFGEKEAAKMLEDKGFRIVARNWRMGHLEVDIIAQNKREIIFAEVKTRSTTFGDKQPEEYVDESKKRRMTAAANAYIKLYRTEQKPRFDIIGLVVNPLTMEVTYRCHMENAFMPHQRTVSANSYNGQWRWGHRTHTIGKKKL